MGELLEIRKSYIHDNHKEVKTLIGFTTGEWESNYPENNVILPENRIQGFLIITSKRFVMLGTDRYEIGFDEIVTSFGGGDAKENANTRIKSFGNKKYQFRGDVYAGAYEVKRPISSATPTGMMDVYAGTYEAEMQDKLAGFDKLYIAILYNEINALSIFNGINNKVFDILDDLSDFLHTPYG